MNCSNCGQPVSPDDVFCATCGADLAAQRATAAATPASVPEAASPKKNRALVITLIVLGVLLLLCSCAGVGGYLLYMPIRSEIEEVITPEPSASDEATAVGGALSTTSHATPEEAVEAELPADWVVKKVEDGAERVVFWAGPPNSEFTTIYVVEVQADEKWRVTESAPLEAGGDVSADSEAAATVQQFLTFVQTDEGLEAQKLTVAPFHEDAAAAGVSNGQFTSFSIDAVEAAGDGTYFVSTTEVWKTGTDHWTYRVVPTDAGMRIQELMPATK